MLCVLWSQRRVCRPKGRSEVQEHLRAAGQGEGRGRGAEVELQGNRRVGPGTSPHQCQSLGSGRAESTGSAAPTALRLQIRQHSKMPHLVLHCAQEGLGGCLLHRCGLCRHTRCAYCTLCASCCGCKQLALHWRLEHEVAVRSARQRQLRRRCGHIRRWGGHTATRCGGRGIHQAWAAGVWRLRWRRRHGWPARTASCGCARLPSLLRLTAASAAADFRAAARWLALSGRCTQAVCGLGRPLVALAGRGQHLIFSCWVLIGRPLPATVRRRR